MEVAFTQTFSANDIPESMTQGLVTEQEKMLDMLRREYAKICAENIKLKTDNRRVMGINAELTVANGCLRELLVNERNKGDK